MSKESKAQRIERIKQTKDGLDVLADIYRYAQSDEEIDQEDIDRFKWYGLYTQNTNLQAQDDKTRYFMLRVKLKSGEADIAQLKALGEISLKYARGSADITTRQDIQLHFIKIEDIPAIFEALKSVGLNTAFASGDVPRNVVISPLMGIGQDEVYDVRDIVEELERYFDANRELSNLPRKYKVSIESTSSYSIASEIQDLSFSAAKSDDGEVTFEVRVGGGLASNRRIASYIGNATPQQVVSVAKAVTRIYRDNGRRENRNKARLGHLIEEWGLQKFVDAVQAETGFKLKKPGPKERGVYGMIGCFGVHDSSVNGESYIGCAVDGGRIGAERLLRLGDIVQRHGGTTIRVSASQNLIVKDVPTQNAVNAALELKCIGIYPYPSSFMAKTLSCTGMNFCKFAISETKDLASKLVEHLQRKFSYFFEPISISVNGCPNSCAHPYISDIGLVGCKVKHGDEYKSGFELILGGRLEGEGSTFANRTGIKFLPEQAFEIVESVIESYVNSHYENFRDYALGEVYA